MITDQNIQYVSRIGMSLPYYAFGREVGTHAEVMEAYHAGISMYRYRADRLKGLGHKAVVAQFNRHHPPRRAPEVMR